MVRYLFGVFLEREKTLLINSNAAKCLVTIIAFICGGLICVFIFSVKFFQFIIMM